METRVIGKELRAVVSPIELAAVRFTVTTLPDRHCDVFAVSALNPGKRPCVMRVPEGVVAFAASDVDEIESALLKGWPFCST